MPTVLQSRVMPYRFESLPSLTREKVILWNWYCRVGPGQNEWTSWITDILGHLIERPAGLQLQLVQTHMVEAEFGEKTLTFGTKLEVSLGRGTDSEVVLPSKAIASRHARLTLTEGQCALEDLGGKLGTYLWDKRIQPSQPQVLRDGDQFSIFPYRFRVALEERWDSETAIALDQCRIRPFSRAEFVTTSPAGWRIFVVNPHPDGERALLDVSPDFLAEVRRRILAPLGMQRGERTVPSDDALLGFVLLGMLERLNRQLKFPLQFSFARGSAKTLADATRGMLLSSAVRIGDLSGHFRIFLPLEFLAACMPGTPDGWQSNYPAGLCWSFPVAAGFVDLSPSEIAQVGLGDILVAETAPQVLFPNDFGKGWAMAEDGSNSGRLRFDKYFERNISVDTGGETVATGVKPDIGALPLRLHVIVGEKEFTLAEIQSLSPGTIVELESIKSDPVRLMVNGRILGEGELVDVEGKLAVKVLGWRST